MIEFASSLLGLSNPRLLRLTLRRTFHNHVWRNLRLNNKGHKQRRQNNRCLTQIRLGLSVIRLHFSSRRVETRKLLLNRKAHTVRQHVRQIAHASHFAHMDVVESHNLQGSQLLQELVFDVTCPMPSYHSFASAGVRAPCHGGLDLHGLGDQAVQTDQLAEALRCGIEPCISPRQRDVGLHSGPMHQQCALVGAESASGRSPSIYISSPVTISPSHQMMLVFRDSSGYKSSHDQVLLEMAHASLENTG